MKHVERIDLNPLVVIENDTYFLGMLTILTLVDEMYRYVLKSLRTYVTNVSVHPNPLLASARGWVTMMHKYQHTKNCIK